MQTEIFGLWGLILILMIVYSLWKRNAATLMFAGLLMIPFGFDLTFNGLDIVNGIDRTTGAYTFETVLPSNDILFAVIALSTFPISTVILFFTIQVLYREIFTMSKAERI